MEMSYKQSFNALKAKIRDFEDRRIGPGELAKEIFHAAKVIQAEDNAELRRSIERLGNRMAILAEEGRTISAREKAIELVDELNGRLVDAGL